jgi:hypothetical protein
MVEREKSADRPEPGMRDSDVRGRSQGSRWSFLVLLVFVIGVFAAPSSALAITEGHTYSFSFGSSGTGAGQFEVNYGMGVAIDRSNGDVYVTDGNNHRVEKFAEDGSFMLAFGYGVKNGANEAQVCVASESCQSGIPGGGPGQLEDPNGLAVDNSGGENDGDVYVVDSTNPIGDPGLEYVLKFDENGHYLGKIDGTGSPLGPFETLSWHGAVAVDGKGYVWVASDYNSRFGFTFTRVTKFSNEIDNEYVGGSEWQGARLTDAIAVNQTGSRVFLMGSAMPLSEEEFAVWRYSGNGSTRQAIAQGGHFEGPGWLAIDPISENVYASWNSFGATAINEFNPFGKQLGAPIGPGVVGVADGFAVNASMDTVYVTDPRKDRVSVFVPRTAPDVVTGAAINPGHESATLTGEIVPDGGNVTECQFELGTSTSYSTVVPCEQSLPYSSQETVTADVNGLTRESTYHYRLVAANSLASEHGDDRTFTPHGVIGLTTEDATGLTKSGATLNGSFDPNHETTRYYFEWGTDTSYGHVTPTQETPSTTSGSTAVSADLSGLDSYSTYHFRVVAENSLGTSYGDDVVLRTAPPDPPSVAETAASSITDTSVHLSASVVPNFSDTVYRFQYGPDEAYGAATPTSEPIGSDQTAHAADADLTGLEPDTTYHFRVIATNFGGSTSGPDGIFTTGGKPVIGSVSASNATTTGVTLSAIVRPALSPTTVQFEYGLSTAYGRTAESAPLSSDDTPHQAIAAVSGLAAGSTYHFRAVATNAYGVTTGPDQVFNTTAAASPPPPSPPIKCRKHFIRRHHKCIKRNRQKNKRHGHR